ncbi:MAG: hypothetical protein ACI4P7_05805 [Bacilli bacterium]
MQKCNSNADKKINKNNGKKHDKTVVCDGFSCKIINDDKNIKSDKKIMIDLNIK